MKAIEKAFGGATVVLTGAAGGLGSNMARILSPCWRRALLIDIHREGLEKISKELDPTGEKILSRVIDFSQPGKIFEGLADLPEEFKAPDLVINNAGFSRMARVEEAPFKDFEEMVAVNYLAVVAVIQFFLPAMLKAKKGHLLTIASGSGILSTYAASAYCASKFATVGFMEALRQELKGTGVKSSSVLLPTVQTSFHQKVLDSYYGDLARSLPTFTPEEAARQVLKRAARGQELIRFGVMLRFALFLHSHFPGIFRAVMGLNGYMANRKYLQLKQG